MKRIKKNIEGYISTCIGYLGEGTICTQPNSFGAMRKNLSVEFSSDNTIELSIDKKGKLISLPEFKTLYAVYKKMPDQYILTNMQRSNERLKESGKNLQNCIYKCIIPAGSFIENNVEVSEIIGIKEKMILTNNITLIEKVC